MPKEAENDENSVNEEENIETEEPQDPFLHINQDQLEEFRSYKDSDKVLERKNQINFLCSLTSVAHYNSNPRSQLKIEFIFNALAHAEEIELNPIATIYFLSILIHIYSNTEKLCTRSIFTNNQTPPTLEEAYEEFSALIRRYCVEKSDDPESKEIFTLADVKSIVQYTSSTFFRQYEIYCHMFANAPATILKTKPIVIELPMRPAKLALAKK